MKNMSPKQIWDLIYKFVDANAALASHDASEDESEEVARIFREEYDPTFDELVSVIGDPLEDHT